MRVAAIIIGVIGSFTGFIAGVLALTVGGIATAFGAEDSGLVVNLSLGAIAASVVGLTGAALAAAKPRLSAALMMVSSVAGVISISAFYVLPAILLVIASILAFIGRGERSSG